MFQEAKDKYRDTNVLFREYLEQLPIVESRDELGGGYKFGYKKSDGSSPTSIQPPKKMVEDYIFRFDGLASDRLVREMSETP